MADPKYPRHFTDEFKRQIVELINAGKPKPDVVREYDLCKSTVDRWVKSINASGSPRAADNRTPEQNRIIELERENRRLRMEVDVLKRLRTQEVQMPPQRAQRGRAAQRGGQALRRACAARLRVQRPDLRARRRRMELRLPARRPAQPRDRRALGGAAQGRRTGEGGVRDGRVPPVRHPGLPYGIRGSEFGNAKIGEMLDAFGIERSLSRKGCPYDNAVDESTNKILKAEFVYREAFGTTRELRAKLADYVHWCNNFRIHSTLGYMTPVEFRKAGLVLPESSK